jgi:hypothetical protein
MGEFTANVAVAYQMGTARGERSILSAMDLEVDELFASFGQSINDLIIRHLENLEARQLPPVLIRRHSKAEPKARWVDGTPEYALHIYGLHKLFPEALFVHVVRDVTSVVRSMLNFNRVVGTHLVANEEEAYKYWLLRVRACLKAEEAYGPRVIRRVLYSSLVSNPEAAIRSLLDFVGEPYDAQCLVPLAERINSSNVPPDFKLGDPVTDPPVVERAKQLSDQLQNTPQPSEISADAARKLEAEFNGQVEFHRDLGRKYSEAQTLIATLQRERDASGASGADQV